MTLALVSNACGRGGDAAPSENDAGHPAEDAQAEHVDKPVINSLTASPSIILTNAISHLSWDVSNAGSLEVSGIGAVTGSGVDVSPAETTTYTLTATNEAGSVSASTTVTTVPVLAKGPYFGATPPGETPEVFAPDLLASLSAFVEATAFSPDGAEAFLAVGNASYSSYKLYSSNRVGETWMPFTQTSFAKGFNAATEPVFSADGAVVTFTGSVPSGSLDLWTVGRSGETWGSPVQLPSPINSTAKEWRGSYMSDGTYYFGSTRSGSQHIYRADGISGQPVVELVSAPINDGTVDGDPCIAPDGHFLIFYSVRGGAKSSDLYVSFTDGQNGWKTPINLGDNFNTANDEYGANLSTDGKYLFFTRHTTTGNSILWVSISAIEKLNN